MKNITKILIAFIAVASPKLWANEDLSYTVDAALIYLDQLKRPNISSHNAIGSQAITKSTMAAANPSRTLGLYYAKIGLTWKALQSSTLHLGLRPDATMNRNQKVGEPNRDFDTRAGKPYRSAAPIQLLDSYIITINHGQDFDVSLGVFEDIAPFAASYPQILAFGLATQLPQKYSGIEFVWRQQLHEPPTSPPKPQSGRRFSLTIFEGHEDRAEQLSESPDSFDQGPSAQDPYLGAALKGALYRGGNEYSLLMGYGDTKVSTGRKNEMFGELVISQNYNLFSPGNLTFNTRFAQERWHVKLNRHRELRQQSYAFTIRQQIVAENYAIAGIHYGTSERHADNDPSNLTKFSGWHIDIGYIRRLRSAVEFALFASQESRHVVNDGIKTGGFTSGGDDHASLMRFAMQIRYLLAQN